MLFIIPQQKHDFSRPRCVTIIGWIPCRAIYFFTYFFIRRISCKNKDQQNNQNPAFLLFYFSADVAVFSCLNDLN